MNSLRIGFGVLCGLALVTGCSHNKAGSTSTQTTVRGENGEKLTIVKPLHQTIARGETETMTVSIKRSGFSGPVSIRVSQLPSGVEAVDEPRSTSDDQVQYVLRASQTADLVKNHTATVTAEGPNGIRATETFELTIAEQ